VTLVSDGVDASWPGFRGIEVIGDVFKVYVGGGDVVMHKVGDSTQELVLDLSKGHSFELGWEFSLPGVLVGVKEIN
jgi:hypothetical protein